jgi:hypothetical protein
MFMNILEAHYGFFPVRRKMDTLRPDQNPDTHHSGFMAHNPEDYSFESEHSAISMYCITNLFVYQPTKYPE